jgi:hypothetical protein
MSRRRTPQRTTDDLAFPIRVKLRMPSTDLGHVLTDILLWLSAEAGPGEYAHHHSQTLGGDAMALYFRRSEDLVRFLEAFPLLELADGTTSRAYTSPLFPLGRPKGAG